MNLQSVIIVAMSPRTVLIALAIVVGAILLPSCASTPEAPRTAIEKTMTVTAYCPCKQCCSWERTWYGKPVYSSGSRKGEYKKIGQTASGEKARPGTIAADARYPFGTVIDVPGYGQGVVLDRGGAITGDHIDLFFKSHKKALQWGRRQLKVTVYLPANSGRVASR